MGLVFKRRFIKLRCTRKDRALRERNSSVRVSVECESILLPACLGGPGVSFWDGVAFHGQSEKLTSSCRPPGR